MRQDGRQFGGLLDVTAPIVRALACGYPTPRFTATLRRTALGESVGNGAAMTFIRSHDLFDAL